MINEKKSVVYEGKNFSKDGNEYWVITTLTPMLNKDGKVEKIIAIDSNITERKQIEEDLLLANKIAEHSLKKGNKALNELMKAKRELEESMKVKEQFLAKMSHEIRTPMNAIVGLTDILLEGNISLEQKECLEAVKLSSDNLLSIINDILDFSKLESGKLFLETLPFSLKEVIDGVFVTLRLTASHKGLDLSYSIQEDVPEIIVGDALRLRQILLNLLSNSVKFTEHGSVRVDVELTGKTTENSTLRFKISDTGIGIPEDRLATIFESFTQASNETSRKYGGTGLGLTIVKQLTELQGGTVEVKSVLNKGTEFFVTLSFKNKTEEDNASKLSQKENEREMIGAIKVLLAEDNEMNQMVAQKVLVKWGFTVEIAENGKHTIQKLTDSNYDLILMDIQMPEMDGYEATKFIRNNMPAPKSGIPIIAMTAHAIVGEAEKCIALGMDDYISKPFNQKDLYEKIAKQIKKAGTMENKERHKENGKAKEEDFSCIDLSYLEEIAEGNSEFVRKMISAFLNQAPGMLNDMKKFTAEKRWKELRGVSHKIKPSLDFVGIHSLKETVGNLEKYSAEESNLELIPGMVKEVNLICTQAIAELEKKIAQYS
jgi:signal transduction histidine kinase/DNA-binding NarL/FixJ family response regulator